MTVHGYSTGTPGADTTEETVAAQAVAIEAIVDQLMWLRRKLATLLDQTVEPDDIRTDDALKNAEREA